MKQLYILCFLLAALVSMAQEKFIQSQLDEYNENITPEHIDIHFDKDIYFSGEKIWYALYLNNVPRNPSIRSVIAYVEIRDRRDSVIFREKIRCFNGFGHGDIALPKKLTTGNYLVTAYTFWMKNVGSSYKHMISVINTDMPLPVAVPKNAQSGDLRIDKTGVGRFEFYINRAGKVVAHDREKVFFSKQVVQNETITLLCEKSIGEDVFVSLIDSKGTISEMYQIRNDRSGAEIKVSIEKKELRVGQNTGATIELLDDHGLTLNGGVSISVHEDFNRVEAATKTVSNNLFVSKKDINKTREYLIYPASKNSIKTLPVMMVGEPFPLLITDSMRQRLTSAGMRRRVMNTYGMNPVFLPDNYYLLPADLSYVPSNYSLLPNVEEFIKELVSQVKIIKNNGGKKMKLRNITSTKVALYPEPALLLVDGFIIENANEIFDIPLKEIDRIDLTWTSDKINSLAIFSLADNGIISITTLNPNRFSSNHTNLFKDIDIPMHFSLQNSQNEMDRLPAFQNPLYWNPEVRIEGKSKIEIQAGDYSGNYIIDIRGFSDNGKSVFFSMPLKIYNDSID